MEEEDGGAHAPSTESQFPSCLSWGVIFTHTACCLLAGAPAADVRTHTLTQRED